MREYLYLVGTVTVITPMRKNINVLSPPGLTNVPSEKKKWVIKKSEFNSTLKMRGTQLF